jgi:hypothetical protein
VGAAHMIEKATRSGDAREAQAWYGWVISQVRASVKRCLESMFWESDRF